MKKILILLALIAPLIIHPAESDLEETLTTLIKNNNDTGIATKMVKFNNDLKEDDNSSKSDYEYDENSYISKLINELHNLSVKDLVKIGDEYDQLNYAKNMIIDIIKDKILTQPPQTQDISNIIKLIDFLSKNTTLTPQIIKQLTKIIQNTKPYSSIPTNLSLEQFKNLTQFAPFMHKNHNKQIYQIIQAKLQKAINEGQLKNIIPNPEKELDYFLIIFSYANITQKEKILDIFATSLSNELPKKNDIFLTFLKNTPLETLLYMIQKNILRISLQDKLFFIMLITTKAQRMPIKRLLNILKRFPIVKNIITNTIQEKIELYRQNLAYLAQLIDNLNEEQNKALHKIATIEQKNCIDEYIKLREKTIEDLVKYFQNKPGKIDLFTYMITSKFQKKSIEELINDLPRYTQLEGIIKNTIQAKLDNLLQSPKKLENMICNINPRQREILLNCITREQKDSFIKCFGLEKTPIEDLLLNYPKNTANIPQERIDLYNFIITLKATEYWLEPEGYNDHEDETLAKLIDTLSQEELLTLFGQVASFKINESIIKNFPNEIARALNKKNIANQIAILNKIDLNTIMELYLNIPLMLKKNIKTAIQETLHKKLLQYDLESVIQLYEISKAAIKNLIKPTIIKMTLNEKNQKQLFNTLAHSDLYTISTLINIPTNVPNLNNDIRSMANPIIKQKVKEGLKTNKNEFLQQLAGFTQKNRFAIFQNSTENQQQEILANISSAIIRSLGQLDDQIKRSTQKLPITTLIHLYKYMNTIKAKNVTRTILPIMKNKLRNISLLNLTGQWLSINKPKNQDLLEPIIQEKIKKSSLREATSVAKIITDPKKQIVFRKLIKQQKALGNIK